MDLVYQGKTKNIYRLPDGNYELKFKDDVTGENGVFDPGANTVGLSIEGIGHAGLRMTEYFFRKIQSENIPTHYLASDLEKTTMAVRPAQLFGKGLEVICRFRAVGSFLRRYGMYAKEGQALDAFVEITLKDDEHCDPPISKDALAMLGIMTADEYDQVVALTKQISTLIADDLAAKGMTLYDIKLEFGKIDGQIALVDEISGGNMRVYQDGRCLEPLTLVQKVLNA